MVNRAMSDTCRSCNQPITFAITGENRRMPINPPTPDGNLYLYRKDGTLRVSTDSAVLPPGTDLVTVTSHFATCPNADKHRRPR